MDNSVQLAKVKALIHRLGLKYKLPDKVIKEIVESQFRFAGATIKELDLKEVITEEDLDNTKTNFYFKKLGKLHIPFLKLYNINERRSKNKFNKNK